MYQKETLIKIGQKHEGASAVCLKSIQQTAETELWGSWCSISNTALPVQRHLLEDNREGGVWGDDSNDDLDDDVWQTDY